MNNKIYLIDLDGTMYRGNTMIEGAKEFVDYLIESNQTFLFLTNNSSRTLTQNVEHMEKMGFNNIKKEHFFTSAMAAASYVSKLSDKKRCDYIGMEGLKEALLNYGFTICDSHVDYLFVGLDRQGTYEEYSKKLPHLLNGAKLIGTNGDRLLANDTGFNVGNGAIVAMFEYASNQKSEAIGKPNEVILNEALAYIGKQKKDCAIIGDNLETDIKLGVDFGVDTIFITTGVHTLEDIRTLEIEPTMCITTLLSLIKS